MVRFAKDYETMIKMQKFCFEWATECLRVLKPGGFLLAFGGTRTYHRLACGIEDAGFEIRDCIQWLYGSGFPKSLNIGKQIDKMQGNKREIIGEKTCGYQVSISKSRKEQGYKPNLTKSTENVIVDKGNTEWEGWGTAMKPSHEDIVVAQKPLNSVPNSLEQIKCQLNLFVNVVERISKLNLQELNEDMLNSVLTNVYPKQNIKEDLEEVMDILQSEQKKENINWSMMLLWKNIWEEILNLLSISTIEIKNEMTIELRTLNLLLGKLTIQDILKYEILPNGEPSNALLVENLLKGELLKLRSIHILSAQENVILKEEEKGYVPNASPIVVARKPLSEKNVALNVLKWGTGGINIDACRIGTEVRINKGMSSNKPECAGTFRDDNWIPKNIENVAQGRFPANTIFDEEAGKLLDEQSGDSISKKQLMGTGVENIKEANIYGKYMDIQSVRGHSDKGGASRFFYCAKASKSERNLGCEEFPNIIKKENMINSKHRTDERVKGGYENKKK